MQVDFQNLSPKQHQQRLQKLDINAGVGFRDENNCFQRGGDGFTAGEIISKDDKSVTVKSHEVNQKLYF